MKTIVKITNDYNYGLSFEDYKDDLIQLSNELNIYCELSNNRYINIIEDNKSYQSSEEDYNTHLTVSSKGYSQSDWQVFTIHYNKEDIKDVEYKSNFDSLVKLLERSFTHFNDYQAEKYDQTIINGKEFNSDPYDYASFYIDHIEFPGKDDVLKAYNDIYGKDYDDIIINID